MADLQHVLIVDDSRMVRASLAAILKGHYEIREECDGEAAWQSLVLDNSLKAVISDLQMPKLDGFGLLERVRSSKLRRLQEIPFILVSGDEAEEVRERAKSAGVSDFITKGVGTSELLTRLNNLLALSEAREHIEHGRDQMVRDPITGLFTRKFIEMQVAQALAHAVRRDGDLSVMVLAVDNHSNLDAKSNDAVAEQAGNRIAKMLASKMRQEDSLGHYAAAQYAIVAPGTSMKLCTTFGERVRQAVEVAKVAAQGQQIGLTVSIGIASIPNDQAASADALLEMAGTRMREAMRAGGNRVACGEIDAAAKRSMSLQHALELLRAGRSEGVVPQLAELGLQVLPLLKLLDEKFGFNLPLSEIWRRLNERAP